MSPDFHPSSALAGGVLLGLSAALLMALFGRVAGIGGLVLRLLPPRTDDATHDRVAILAGLAAAPLLSRLVTGAPIALRIEAGPATLVLAGLLVGFGSAWGSGCTSGHGISGLARLSRRSAVATATFMSVAALTVLVLRHLL